MVTLSELPLYLSTSGLAACAAAAAWRYRRRARALSAELDAARLATLGGELRAHFLLNALNTAAELVHHEPETADRILSSLGHLLRHALHHDARPEIPLAEELALTRDYVAVERARFGEGLVVDWAVAADALSARVPALLLQPLVENAVRHGIAPRRASGARRARGTVRISGERDGDALHLVVTDDGVGLDGRQRRARPPRGVGLRNVRARLDALYGAASDLEITSRPGRGCRVVVRLPWRPA